MQLITEYPKEAFRHSPVKSGLLFIPQLAVTAGQFECNGRAIKAVARAGLVLIPIVAECSRAWKQDGRALPVRAHQRQKAFRDLCGRVHQLRLPTRHGPIIGLSHSKIRVGVKTLPVHWNPRRIPLRGQQQRMPCSSPRHSSLSAPCPSRCRRPKTTGSARSEDESSLLLPTRQPGRREARRPPLYWPTSKWPTSL